MRLCDSRLWQTAADFLEDLNDRQAEKHGHCFTASFHGQLGQSGIRCCWGTRRCPQDIPVVGRRFLPDRDRIELRRGCRQPRVDSVNSPMNHVSIALPFPPSPSLYPDREGFRVHAEFSPGSNACNFTRAMREESSRPAFIPLRFRFRLPSVILWGNFDFFRQFPRIIHIDFHYERFLKLYLWDKYIYIYVCCMN